MDSKDKRVISDCLMRRKTECHLVSRDERKIHSMFEEVMADSPLVFGCSSYRFIIGGGCTEFYPEYTMNDSDYRMTAERCYKVAEGIVDKGRDLSDEDFIHHLHSHLINNVRYVESPDSHTIIGPLLRGQGVCDGISKAFKLCCDLRGIGCHNVQGVLRGDRHMWSRVSLGGNWYNIDVTADLGVSDEGFEAFDYYLVSDRTIMKDHTLDSDVDLICNRDDRDFYISNGLVMANPYALRDAVLEHSSEKGFRMAFRVTDPVPGKDHTETIFSVLDSVFGKGRYACDVYANIDQYDYRIIVRR